ncbi:DUF4190 domain-containing protein [Streptomyces turgidiscabies]|uniref:DUF4190 domain-containing protein n=1 Tax=Streptomyces turgidiscabies TaxID=85558 RepID=A0ABU0RM22_9ACTN|nr:DUF4190 domain-containing protein [Streptomyces turgidiscabies]MDQ0933036.1 hypothetical protein [Streptomyces turgidiscabies]
MSDAAQPPQSPENFPAEGAIPEGAATGTPARVPLDKPPVRRASDGRADSGAEIDPWAPPAEDAPGSGSTLYWNKGDTNPPAAPAPQSWANPFAPPGGTVVGVPQDNPFAPPAPGVSHAQPAAPGEPVPPPPIAPDGPGPSPYGSPSYPSGAGYGHPQQPGYAGPGYGWSHMAPQPMNGMGTASLVVGIVSVVFFCLWPLAITMGILAVVFGMVARQRARRGQATNAGQALAGIICGVVAIVLAVAIGVVIILSAARG